mmetsp:Transcript_104879/g.163561  ORF Transcript_104879/g.163561 Transcript_104879/m.163561 type:complete len:97 (+) Transcript_104879:153-443(+)
MVCLELGGKDLGVKACLELGERDIGVMLGESVINAGRAGIDGKWKSDLEMGGGFGQNGGSGSSGSLSTVSCSGGSTGGVSSGAGTFSVCGSARGET